MKPYVKVVCVVCLTLALAVPSFAIFGLGDIVYDPAVWGEAVEQVIRLEQQYEQLVTTYQQIRQQYEQQLWMAQLVPVNMMARYRSIATLWQNFTANDTYGDAGAWTDSWNTGQGVTAAYSQATTSLGTYGGSLENIPSDQLDRVKRSYATVELADGANIQGIETVGRLRANASAVEQTIQALEADSLSSDPAMNTEIAVLNKINAANVIALRSSQDTNQLLVSLAEQQVLEAARNRDAEAEAINAHIRFRTEGKAVLDAQTQGTSDAMLAWRMP